MSDNSSNENKKAGGPLQKHISLHELIKCSANYWRQFLKIHETGRMQCRRMDEYLFGICVCVVISKVTYNGAKEWILYLLGLITTT
jgi:hypothetical protein